MHRSNLNTSFYKQFGAVMSEYLLTTGVITAALFLPIPGVGLSAIDIVINALNAFQNHSTVFLSMP